MSGPFPARTIDAVEACTRILAGSTDAALPLPNAATLSGLRAAADRAALRARHQHPDLLARHCPDSARAAEIYVALEDARLDAIGATWLTGVAANLLAHPGADDDGIRWLAFELLSGRASPPEKRALVDAVRPALTSELLTALAALTIHLRQAAHFAPKAAAFALAAAPRLPAPGGRLEPRARVTLPVRLREEWRRREQSSIERGPGRADRTRSPEGGSANGSAPSADAGAEGASRRSDYRAFTTAYDRVVSASTLVNRDELTQLRARLDADHSSPR